MGKKRVEKIDGMKSPNHNIGLDWALKDGSKSFEDLFPVLELKVPAGKGAGSSEGYAFFDYTHDAGEITGKCEPPTWMDPVLFIELADKREEIRQLAAKCIKKNTVSRADQSKMEGILQELFEQEYLVYAFEKFAKCRGLIAEWLFAHYAYLQDPGEGVLPDKKERKETLESRRLTRLKNKGDA
jgi:hypothetical protein